ncbi:MAG: hypothetical protein RR404_02565 [Bacilli bacterium]
MKNSYNNVITEGEIINKINQELVEIQSKQYDCNNRISKIDKEKWKEIVNKISFAIAAILIFVMLIIHFNSIIFTICIVTLTTGSFLKISSDHDNSIKGDYIKLLNQINSDAKMLIETRDYVQGLAINKQKESTYKQIVQRTVNKLISENNLNLANSSTNYPKKDVNSNKTNTQVTVERRITTCDSSDVNRTIFEEFGLTPYQLLVGINQGEFTCSNEIKEKLRKRCMQEIETVKFKTR